MAENRKAITNFKNCNAWSLQGIIKESELFLCVNKGRLKAKEKANICHCFPHSYLIGWNFKIPPRRKQILSLQLKTPLCPDTPKHPLGRWLQCGEEETLTGAHASVPALSLLPCRHLQGRSPDQSCQGGLHGQKGPVREVPFPGLPPFPGANPVKKKRKPKADYQQVFTRHINQIFIRGENVLLVHLAQ